MPNLPETNPTPIPINDPSMIKKNNNPSLSIKIVLLTITFIFLFVALVYASYWYGKRQPAEEKRSPSPSSTQEVPYGDENLDTDVEYQRAMNQLAEEVPLANNLYLGSYQGKEALFITNAKLSQYHEAGVAKTKNTSGYLLDIEGSNYQPFDYPNLANPKKVLALDPQENVTGITSFIFNQQKDFIYIIVESLPAVDSYPNITQHVYQVNLKTLTKKPIWSHKIGDATYPKKGPAMIDQVAGDQYLTLFLGICYACEGFDPHGTVVVNLTTGKEKYFGETGNFSFDLNKKTLTYQPLTPQEESCEIGPYCDDGTMTVYKPAGELTTSPLP